MPKIPRYRPADAWILLFALLYAALLNRLYGGLGETLDGFICLRNALVIGGASVPNSHLTLAKAPLGSLVLAPLAAFAYAGGGPEAALRASHFFQAAGTALLVVLAWRFFLGLYGRALAAPLAVVLAFNPVLLRNAPFSNFDVSGAALALLFLMTVLGYAQAPSRRGYLAIVLAGAACFLVKYHQGMLAALPALLALFSTGSRRQRLALAAAPGLIAAMSLAVLALFAAVWIPIHSPFSLRSDLRLVTSANITGRPASLVYFQELAYQLGPALSLFAAFGFFLWLARPGLQARLLAAGLAVPLLILSTVIRTSESRYTVFLLPLVYAAAGACLEALARGLGGFARWGLAGLLLLAAPWRKSYASVERLVEDQNFITRLPSSLGRYGDSRSSEAGCVAWMRGEMRFPVPPSKSPMMDNWTSPLMADNLQFYTKASVEEVEEPEDKAYLDAGRFAGSIGCRPRLLLIPRYHSSDPQPGGRWTGGDLGRAFDLTSTPARRYRILQNGLALP